MSIAGVGNIVAVMSREGDFPGANLCAGASAAGEYYRGVLDVPRDDVMPQIFGGPITLGSGSVTGMSIPAPSLCMDSPAQLPAEVLADFTNVVEGLADCVRTRFRCPALPMRLPSAQDALTSGLGRVTGLSGRLTIVNLCLVRAENEQMGTTPESEQSLSSDECSPLGRIGLAAVCEFSSLSGVSVGQAVMSYVLGIRRLAQGKGDAITLRGGGVVAAINGRRYDVSSYPPRGLAARP